MLVAIKKIQGMGVFGNFIAANDLPDFERFNVLYGENGSGKTTLSRLLGALNAGEHPDYPTLDFTVSTQAGALSKGQKYARRVKVFNSDYVDANIGQCEGPLRHILIVGEENKALAAEVVAEKATHADRVRQIEVANKAIEKLDSEKGKIFSAIAKTISEATSGSTLRSYRKPDAEAAFARTANLEALDEGQLEISRGTIRQEPLDAIDAAIIPAFKGDQAQLPRSIIEAANDLPELVQKILLQTAQASAVKRLTEEPLIAKWVEEGLEIHRSHASERCEFCDQTLPATRLAQLAEHFGAEDQRLKAEIESAQREVEAILLAFEGVSLPSKTALYAELRGEFDVASLQFDVSRRVVIAELKAISAQLDKKLMQRATACADAVKIDTSNLSRAAESASDIIRRHNEKTADFEQAKERARKALEGHYLSTIAEQVKDIEAQAETRRREVAKLSNGAPDLDDPRGLKALAESIQTKEARLANAHIGGADLTERLKNFLGRSDLKFEAGADGYHVKRNGKPAKRLSEGEKTAIAFLHFIVQLREQDFNLAEGVVVIDDPISSLDAASIYQAFAFLKNAVRDAKQVIILTHNFDFLKLILNWFKSIKKSVGKRAYFMILCAEQSGRREARIVEIDKLLTNHPTEYHYLFNVLESFKSDGTIMSAYHIPNVARKVLETFLEFHIPSDDSLYEKLEQTDFDAHKKTAIYKFANDLSHSTGKGFDPALVAETQKNVAYLLEMIQAIAPTHYAGLRKPTSNGQ
jgi:wobble nucleotide-excising tRNase